jgi:hypothetical protein
MSEQTAASLPVLVPVFVLVLPLLGLLLLLQPVTSAAVTTHAAASRLPNALHRTMTPLINRRAGMTARLTLKHPAG